jgi:protein-ribulosamine 3-kinase
MQRRTRLLDSIQQTLDKLQVEAGALRWQRDLHGGDINRAASIGDGKSNWFLKFHENAPAGMFQAEAEALAELADSNCIRVPRPLASGQAGQDDWLLIEYIEMSGSNSDALLGTQLARLHAIKQGHFGWLRDNFIGSTPQYNQANQNWCGFWRDQRIRPQLEMARANGFAGRLQADGERLLDSMGTLLGDHQPLASLLHGDLWGGNKSSTREGHPVIFDPASYYGDRETDIAMTELFGGFSKEFYRAYEAVLPLAAGYHQRRNLYNLYHVLNHLNLFGRAYLGRCESMISELLTLTR